MRGRRKVPSVVIEKMTQITRRAPTMVRARQGTRMRELASVTRGSFKAPVPWAGLLVWYVGGGTRPIVVPAERAGIRREHRRENGHVPAEGAR